VDVANVAIARDTEANGRMFAGRDIIEDSATEGP
jgi:hypothetical protein